MKEGLPPAFVLGSGVNALGVARSLGRKGVAVHLFTGNADTIAARSRHLASVTQVDSRNPAATAGLIGERARALGARPALFFLTDNDLRLVSAHRDALAADFHLQLPSARSIDIVTDKAEFGRFTEAAGFPVPRTFAPAALAEVEALAARVRYPVALKPAHSPAWAGRGVKMVRADDAAALVVEWQRLEADTAGGLLVQEFVEAPDDQHYAYYSYRTPERGERTHVTVRKLRVHPIHGGAGAFVHLVQEPELEAVGRAVLERLDYTGIASVCFKRGADGRALMYEVNGRMPQCHTAFRLAGVDLPWLMYRDMIGAPVAAPQTKAGRGAWVALSLDISAFLDYRRAGELGLAAWLLSLLRVRTCAELDLDDPAPFVEFVRRLAARVLRREPRTPPRPSAGDQGALSP